MGQSHPAPSPLSTGGAGSGVNNDTLAGSSLTNSVDDGSGVKDSSSSIVQEKTVGDSSLSTSGSRQLVAQMATHVVRMCVGVMSRVCVRDEWMVCVS